MKISIIYKKLPCSYKMSSHKINFNYRNLGNIIDFGYVIQNKDFTKENLKIKNKTIKIP